MAVETKIQYLKRDDLYKVEKPYNVEFEPPGGDEIQRSNLIAQEEHVTIHAISSSEQFNLDSNGFCVIEHEIALDAQAALADSASVEFAFLKELEQLLSYQFPEYRRIEPIEFLVRTRDQGFPSTKKMLARHEQPARLAHSDYTPRGALLQLKSSFVGQEKYFEGQEFDMINVWRPLAGPNNDWPLALCDYTTVDLRSDVCKGDTIHPDGVGENQLLHANNRHRWYYVEHQKTCDLLIFRNTDSTGRRPNAFHAAFDSPKNQGPPRQSCEVRFLAFR